MVQKDVAKSAFPWRITLVFMMVFSGNFIMTDANESAKRLFDDLLINYNKLRRPSHQNPLIIHIALKLSQIISVTEKDQIMTVSVWLKQVWEDTVLQWKPTDYGNVSVLYVPADMIWTPDLLLFNNAEYGSFNITIPTKVTLAPAGVVTWEAPALFKTMCPINVRWFPFDVQTCKLKFGSRTYTDKYLDLKHIDMFGTLERDNNTMPYGIDLTEYYPSVQWDILAIPALRSNKTYVLDNKNNSTFIAIEYSITLRRKPLFYLVNIILPVVGISFLSVFVFYLPSDSGEKISLSISIVVALTVFFMLLTEIIPATSDVMPMIGKYLLFTMFMVSASVVISVITLNVHFRTPATHRMPKWVKKIFLKTLPKYLFMRRPLGDDESFRRVSSRDRSFYDQPATSMSLRDASTATYKMPPHHHHPSGVSSAPSSMKQRMIKQPKVHHLRLPGGDQAAAEEEAMARKLESLYYEPAVLKAFANICFIAELLKKKDKDDKIDEDWKFVAMVIDRVFLWIFAVVCLFGTAVIILQADTIYDFTNPVDPIMPTLESVKTQKTHMMH